MKTVNVAVLSAVDTSSQNGSQIDANQLYQASFQSVFGDVTAAGSVKIQMSNDICRSGPEATNFVVTNWSDIPNATSSVASGVAAPIILSTISARWLRAVYTRSGGGSTTIIVNMFAISI